MFIKNIKEITMLLNRCRKNNELVFKYKYKKNLLPFLFKLQEEGIIYKFNVVENKFKIYLKLTRKAMKFSSENKSRYLSKKKLLNFSYKDPSCLYIISNTQGILSNADSNLIKKKLPSGGLFLLKII